MGALSERTSPSAPDEFRIIGRVVPCVDHSVLERGTVVIADGRIAWVGPETELPESYSHLRTEDVGEHTVMPGLVDTHMHISFGEAESEEELSLHTPPAFRAIRAATDAGKVLAAGVTAACDPGGPRGIGTAVRDAIEAGLVSGPRLAAAGRQITTQQGIGDTLPAPLGDLPTSFGHLVRSDDDIRQAIRDAAKDSVDLIKIAGSGPGTAEWGAFSLHELSVAVHESHRLGLPIAIHARSRQSIADAVSAGFDWLMHASYMDTQTMERLIEADIPIVPAMTLLVNSLEAGSGTMPVATLDAMRRELDAAAAILSKAHAEGATLVAGSESGFAMTPYGEWHTREMELFVELLGMSDFDALLCMTRNARRTMPRHGEQVGQLAIGHHADVLIVDGCPDVDIRVLGSGGIKTVYLGGVAVSPSALQPREKRNFERTRLYTRGTYRRAATSSP